MTAQTATDQGGKVETSTFEVVRIRRDFPILQLTINDKPLIYLDNAATAQKPQSVLDALTGYYTTDNANVHRGVHSLSVRATEAYERTRTKTQKLINAARREEIVFVRGASEAINLIAQTYGRTNVNAGDEVLITTMEHHSNIVPWQIMCEQTGATLKVAPINDRAELELDEFEKLVSAKTKIVGVTHVSNALGTINPVKRITEIAHEHGAVVVVDGAQAAPHLSIDVQAIGCDFYALSSHKMFGPTGVGALFGKHDLLEAMPPYQSGGEMIKSVTFDKTVYNDVPHKFEAGTPNIAGVVAFGAAIDYVVELGFAEIGAYEHELLEYGTELLEAIPEVRMIGTAADKAAVLSFVIDGVHPHDVGTILDQEGIAIRTGHHCAQPVMERFGIPATCRASLAFYNTREELDALAAGIRRVVEVFN